MTKRIARSRGTRPVKQNRPNWRKKVMGYTPKKRHFNRPKKIKGKDYEKVEI